MSVIRFLVKIGAFLAGLFVVLNFVKEKEKDQYILLNAENEN